MRLLDRRHKDWTFAVLLAARAERLVREFEESGHGDKDAVDQLSRWSEADYTLFRRLRFSTEDDDDDAPTEG